MNRDGNGVRTVSEAGLQSIYNRVKELDILAKSLMDTVDLLDVGMVLDRRLRKIHDDLDPMLDISERR